MKTTAQTTTAESDREPAESLPRRIRQAWQVLTGRNTFADIFKLGLDIGADLHTQYGTATEGGAR